MAETPFHAIRAWNGLRERDGVFAILSAAALRSPSVGTPGGISRVGQKISAVGHIADYETSPKFMIDKSVGT